MKGHKAVLLKVHLLFLCEGFTIPSLINMYTRNQWNSAFSRVHEAYFGGTRTMYPGCLPAYMFILGYMLKFFTISS